MDSNINCIFFIITSVDLIFSSGLVPILTLNKILSKSFQSIKYLNNMYEDIQAIKNKQLKNILHKYTIYYVHE